MSGGSFDYLGDHASWGMLWEGHDGVLEAMAQALEEYGPPAAKALADTRAVQASLAALKAQAAELADVWHAVEWHHSMDWGLDQVLEAFTEHETKEPVHATDPAV